MRALRRSWLLMLAIFVAVAGAFIAAAALHAPTYRSEVTLSVQPPVAANSDGTSFNAASLQFLVPAVQERTDSKQLRALVGERVNGAEDNFTVTTKVTP